MKRRFKATVTSYVPELNGFGPGWWPESNFPDPIENVDYDIQYILSNILFPPPFFLPLLFHFFVFFYQNISKTSFTALANSSNILSRT